MSRGDVFIEDWDKLERDLKKFPDLLDRNIKKATKASAISARDHVKVYINLGGRDWPPLKEATIKRKGSSKPLIDHGDLLNSVVCKMITGYMFFVGVPRNVKKKNKKMVNIAAVHEYGAPDQNIPARPFIEPGLESATKSIINRYKIGLLSTLRGRLYNDSVRGLD